MRALLVEDSRTCATNAMKTLRGAGYSVEWHRGAKGARCAIEGAPCDIAVVDAQIIDDETTERKHNAGFDVAQLLRAKWPKCRVIVWSVEIASEFWALPLGAAFAWKEDKEALTRAVRGA